MLGVIHIPALDECVYAARGRGAWYLQAGEPPRPAHVSPRQPLWRRPCSSPARCAVSTRSAAAAAFDRLQAAARLSRTWGDGYGYLMVATGRADVMVDPVMALWDAAPLLPILEEAGGKLHRLARQLRPFIPATEWPPTACCMRKCSSTFLEIAGLFPNTSPSASEGLRYKSLAGASRASDRSFAQLRDAVPPARPFPQNKHRVGPVVVELQGMIDFVPEVVHVA